MQKLYIETQNTESITQKKKMKPLMAQLFLRQKFQVKSLTEIFEALSRKMRGLLKHVQLYPFIIICLNVFHWN